MEAEVIARTPSQIYQGVEAGREDGNGWVEVAIALGVSLREGLET
jgi:hypothetical protein